VIAPARQHFPARLGILGGMGPAATADFYRKVVQATPARRDQDHIPVLVEADPGIPDRTEGYLHGGPSPLPWLRKGAKALESRGADLVAMPCNTAHLWYDEIALQLCVPLLHIVDAVVEELQVLLRPGERGLQVGLLATTATLQGALYARRAHTLPSAQRWRWVAPPPSQQGVLQAGIAAVKGGDLGLGRQCLAETRDTLLAQGVDAIVYACTEVPLVLDEVTGLSAPAIDSTAALARVAVRRACAAGG
jgi:aspartate racemase